MDCPRIRFCAMGRLMDGALLTYHVAGDVMPRGELFLNVCRGVLLNERESQRSAMSLLDHEAGAVHYNIEDGILFIVVTHPDFPQHIAFHLLDDVKRNVLGQVGYSLLSVQEGDLLPSTAQLLAELIAQHDEVILREFQADRPRDRRSIQRVIGEERRSGVRGRSDSRRAFLNFEGGVNSTDDLVGRGDGRVRIPLSERQARAMGRQSASWYQFRVKALVTVGLLCALAYLVVPVTLKAIGTI